VSYRTFVGLDVHARSIVGCAVAAGGGVGEVVYRSFGNDPEAVLDWCFTLPGPVKACYEAGPTGYGLVRAFTGVGVEMLVVAPSKLLPQPGARVKTDRRDARHLACLLATGNVTAVRVPTVVEEAARNVFRCREDAQLEFGAATVRLSHFLLRHQITELAGSDWNKVRLEWLAKLDFEDANDQVVFDSYLGAVQSLRRRKLDLERQITQIAGAEPWCGVVDALCCLRGVSTLTAFGLATEIGDWHRLTARSIGPYVGLVPSEHSSGPSHRQGGITKTGNQHVRRLLAEAAWCHKRAYWPSRSPSLQRAWARVDEPVRQRADEANRRLYRQWCKFVDKKKKLVVANTAIARELAGFCHDLAVMVT